MTFKTYLKEYLWNISELMSMGAVPLTYGMMDRLGYIQNNTQAWHLIHSKNLPREYGNQNTKSHISCFTKGSLKLSKLPSSPNMLLRVEGTALISADVDIFTEPSSKNRRWITSTGTELQSNMFEILNKSLTIVTKEPIDLKTHKNYDYLEDIQKLSEKDQIKVYKTYIKLTEKWLNSGGYIVLNKYLKSASNYGYDEIVLTRWKILEVYDINYPQSATKFYCENKKIPYQGYVDWSFIASIK